MLKYELDPHPAPRRTLYDNDENLLAGVARLQDVQDLLTCPGEAIQVILHTADGLTGNPGVYFNTYKAPRYCKLIRDAAIRILDPASIAEVWTPRGGRSSLYNHFTSTPGISRHAFLARLARATPLLDEIGLSLTT